MSEAEREAWAEVGRAVAEGFARGFGFRREDTDDE